MFKRHIVGVVIGVGLLSFAAVAWRCSSVPAQTPTLALTATATLDRTGTLTSSRTSTPSRTNSLTATSTKTLTLKATKAASATPTATKIPTATLTPKVRQVKVTWGGPYTNCHLKLENWGEVVRIARDTILEVVGENKAPVEWEDSRDVFQVKRPDGRGLCFIRKQLVEEVR